MNCHPNEIIIKTPWRNPVAHLFHQSENPSDELSIEMTMDDLRNIRKKMLGTKFHWHKRKISSKSLYEYQVRAKLYHSKKGFVDTPAKFDFSVNLTDTNSQTLRHVTNYAVIGSLVLYLTGNMDPEKFLDSNECFVATDKLIREGSNQKWGFDIRKSNNLQENMRVVEGILYEIETGKILHKTFCTCPINISNEVDRTLIHHVSMVMIVMLCHSALKISLDMITMLCHSVLKN